MIPTMVGSDGTKFVPRVLRKAPVCLRSETKDLNQFENRMGKINDIAVEFHKSTKDGICWYFQWKNQWFSLPERTAEAIKRNGVERYQEFAFQVVEPKKLL